MITKMAPRMAASVLGCALFFLVLCVKSVFSMNFLLRILLYVSLYAPHIPKLIVFIFFPK